MKMTRVLSSLALLSVVAAGSARADFKEFINYCSVGAMRTCASFQVFTTINGGGGTDVVLRVRNMQYVGHPTDNTGGSLITRIGLVAPNVTGAAGLSVAAVGGAAVTGSPSGYWSLANPGSLGGPITLTAGVPSNNGYLGGIRGCSNPFSGAPAHMFRTCNTNAPNGWVEFSFSTSNAWSANDAQVAFLSQDFRNFQGSGLECDTNGGLPGVREACVVVPEPITMVLLGTGLAGVGGAGVLRRRKGLDVESV